MGKVTGFMEYRAHRRGLQARARAPEELQGICHRAGRSAPPTSRRRAAWTAARRFATTAARSTTSFRTSTTWSTAATGRSHRRAAQHQQLPRVHRPHLPGAVRSGLHAERQRRRRWASSRIEHAIIDRAWDEGWVKPQPAEDQDRQEGRRGRLRPGRPGGCAATGARRPRRDRVREERPRRRPAALRHSRLQDGKVAHRPPRRAAARPRA